MLEYTNINHRARRALGLSLNEYSVADMVYHLSSNPKAPKQGWCTMTRENMGKEIDLTKRGLIKLVDRLESMGIVEKNYEGNLRITSKWYETVVNKVHQHGEQSSPDTVNKVHQLGEQSTPYINIDNNNYKLTHTHPPKIENSEPAKPAPDMADMVKAISDKVTKSEKMVETWRMKYRLTANEVKEQADRYAEYVLDKDKRFNGLDAAGIMAVIDKNDAARFQAGFSKTFLINYKREQPKQDRPKYRQLPQPEPRQVYKRLN